MLTQLWLRIGTSGGLLWTRWWTFGFHKMLGSSWVAAQLAASQEGLSSVSKFLLHKRIHVNTAQSWRWLWIIRLSIRRSARCPFHLSSDWLPETKGVCFSEVSPYSSRNGDEQIIDFIKQCVWKYDSRWFFEIFSIFYGIQIFIAVYSLLSESGWKNNYLGWWETLDNHQKAYANNLWIVIYKYSYILLEFYW
jgi:hypothetical protein